MRDTPLKLCKGLLEVVRYVLWRHFHLHTALALTPCSCHLAAAWPAAQPQTEDARVFFPQDSKDGRPCGPKTFAGTARFAEPMPSIDHRPYAVTDIRTDKSEQIAETPHLHGGGQAQFLVLDAPEVGQVSLPQRQQFCFLQSGASTGRAAAGLGMSDGGLRICMRGVCVCVWGGGG